MIWYDKWNDKKGIEKKYTNIRSSFNFIFGHLVICFLFIWLPGLGLMYMSQLNRYFTFLIRIITWNEIFVLVTISVFIFVTFHQTFLSVWPSVFLSICLSICLSIFPSVFPFVTLRQNFNSTLNLIQNEGSGASLPQTTFKNVSPDQSQKTG